MSQNGHVIVSVDGPGTTLEVTLYYTWATRVQEVLAGEGLVEADARFRAVIQPSQVGGETVEIVVGAPEYLAGLAAELQHILNEVALNDVTTFIDAMRTAGCPDEMGEAAWAMVEAVYNNVTGPHPQPQEATWTCVIIEVPPPEPGTGP